MSPERWRRLESLFQEALEREPAARAVFLRESCGDDDALRREIEELLAANRTDAFLDGWAAPAAGRLLEEHSPLRDGDRIGPYQIETKLPAGGMGIVYRARDTRLGRTVAVKILRPSSGRPDLESRFRREAQAIAKLQHANICTLYDVGEDRGRDYLVMEYLEGETLAERLRGGPLPVETARHYAIEITSALEQAHRRGIVHRDLKPANIMITRGGVKLLDFGLASWLRTLEPAVDDTGAETVDVTATQSGAIIGTLPYMAPEQVRGEPADPRADIFAFGLVFFEMLAGRRVFPQADRHSLAQAILNAEAPSLGSRSDVSPELARALDLCLAKDPDERWQHVGDLRRELIWAGTAPRQALSKPSRRQRILSVVAAAAAIVASAWAGYSFHAPAAPRPLSIFIPPPEGSAYRSDGGLAVSPDGQQLAFVAKDAEGNNLLWVRAIDQYPARLLPGTEDARQPFWSPDSRNIAFFAEGRLKRVEASGGPVQAICDASNGIGGVWGEDDTILFSPGHLEPIHRVRASGGASKAVTKIDTGQGDYGHGWPAFAPGGRIVYTAFSVWRPGTLHIVSPDTGEDKPLGRSTGKAVYRNNRLFYSDGVVRSRALDLRRLEFTAAPEAVAPATAEGAFDVARNGSIVYRASEGNNQTEMTWVDRKGVPVGVTFGPDRYSGVSLSPDRRTAAVVITESSGPHIWLYDLEHSGRRSLALNAAFPVWSPDGLRVAYTALNRGAGDIMLRRADGVGAPEVLVQAQTQEAPFGWSPDGKYLGYTEHSQPSNRYSLGLHPLAKGLPPFPPPKLEHSESMGTISPDGQWIAYWSDEDLRPEVFVRHFPDGAGKRRVSRHSGLWPQWRPDGRELFFWELGNRLVAAPAPGSSGAVESGEPVPLFDLRQVLWGPAFAAADGNRFLIIRPISKNGTQPVVALINGARTVSEK